MSKGTEVTASATANYAVDKDISADVTVNEKGDVKATLSHAGVLRGSRRRFRASRRTRRRR